jgi:3-oxoacyl-[acyl-carrier protein] reductase
MDLGIAGRTAIVCASSRGLGRACAEALAEEGVALVINGRDTGLVAQTAKEIAARYSVAVTPVAADITTEQGRHALLQACPDPDILINNNAGPEPGPFLSIDHDKWVVAIEANMIAPILLVKAVLPGMVQRRFGRIVNITSAMVTTPRGHMSLSAGSRAGLTAALKALSLTVVQHNITINNLLPERFDTDRQLQMARIAMARDNITFEQARQKQIESIAAKRLGKPHEFGAACAFLCGAHSGFISGQNLHLDGGSYPALI